MIMMAGLGNPGKKYAITRHNVGFMLVDKLQRKWKFPDFKFNEKFSSELSKGEIKIENCLLANTKSRQTEKLEVLLIKPQTFMNNSGEAVKKTMNFYKISPENIIVVHDDLDIEIGKYKIANNSRAAGHNGVQNIIDKLGTQKFKRVRIGIEGAEKRKNRLISGEIFVLQKFTKEELCKIKKLFNLLPAEICKIL